MNSDNRWLRRLGGGLIPLLLFLALRDPGIASGQIPPHEHPIQVTQVSQMTQSQAQTAQDSPNSRTSSGLTLALYPNVPRFSQFVKVIRERWEKEHPQVPLHILHDWEWDGGYAMDPPRHADVFVFDATYLAQFKKDQRLTPLAPWEVEDSEDFFAFLREGVRDSTCCYWAIPLLACTNVLYYQESDTEMATAESLVQLQKLLGDGYPGLLPAKNQGLMIKGGRSSNAFRYAELHHGIFGRLPDNSKTTLNPQVIAQGRVLLRGAGHLNAIFKSDDGQILTRFFSLEHGRAVVGYTESLAAMPEALRNRVGFRLLPLPGREHPPLFYGDLVGINPDSTKRKLALELANLLAAADTLTAALQGGKDHPPQYLIPARPSVFQSFPDDHLYQRIRGMVARVDRAFQKGGTPVLFTLGENARQWLEAIGEQVHGRFWEEHPHQAQPNPPPVATPPTAHRTRPTPAGRRWGRRPTPRRYPGLGQGDPRPSHLPIRPGAAP